MRNFKPHINPVYPPNNVLIFEEWFGINYKSCNTDRELLPFFPTSYWVNNNYAQDMAAKQEAQDFIDSLPNDKKYFVICQYDDGCLIDWKGKDVLEFNMSKTNGIMMPLICMPHPYHFNAPKQYFANFVGGKTHPMRQYVLDLKDKEEHYVSFDLHNIQDYCRILHESIFTLCFRGYGANSFRIAEAVQYKSIPVYISDEFIIPEWIPFKDFGVTIHSNDVHRIYDVLQAMSQEEIVKKQIELETAYEKYYTYHASYYYIINKLEAEYNNIKEKATATQVNV